MKHGVVLGIAAIAAALVVSALVIDWEGGPTPGNTAFSNSAVKEGRAATATDPVRKEPVGQEMPHSLLD